MFARDHNLLVSVRGGGHNIAGKAVCNGGLMIDLSPMRSVEVNPTARAVFRNYPDLIGSDFADVINTLWPGDYAHEIVRLFRHTLATGERYLIPERVITRAETGMAEYYEWQINRIPLPDGHYGVVCYFRDISQHVLARARLQDSISFGRSNAREFA